MNFGLKELFILAVIATVGIYAFTVETELARFKRQDIFYHDSFEPMTQEQACAVLKLQAFKSQSMIESRLLNRCNMYTEG
jgi:hypothetical protein